MDVLRQKSGIDKGLKVDVEIVYVVGRKRRILRDASLLPQAIVSISKLAVNDQT